MERIDFKYDSIIIEGNEITIRCSFCSLMHKILNIFFSIINWTVISICFIYVVVLSNIFDINTDYLFFISAFIGFLFFRCFETVIDSKEIKMNVHEINNLAREENKIVMDYCNHKKKYIEIGKNKENTEKFVSLLKCKSDKEFIAHGNKRKKNIFLLSISLITLIMTCCVSLLSKGINTNMLLYLVSLNFVLLIIHSYNYFKIKNEL